MRIVSIRYDHVVDDQPRNGARHYVGYRRRPAAGAEIFISLFQSAVKSTALPRRLDSHCRAKKPLRATLGQDY